jgi:hypothetical protein
MAYLISDKEWAELKYKLDWASGKEIEDALERVLGSAIPVEVEDIFASPIKWIKADKKEASDGE